MNPSRILIVEDEGLVAQDLASRLEQLGYAVVGIADTGPAAIELATKHRPDLVLMDIHLAGGSDGIIAAQCFRETLRSPVVFLTAYADTTTLNRAGATAPYGYIVKPFDERSVVATIEMALARRRAELKVEQMERWLATTLSSIGDAVISVNREGAVNFFNPTAEQLTGWLRAEVLGRDYREFLIFVHEEPAAPAPIHPIAEAFATGLVVHLAAHTELVTRSGRRVPVDDSAAPTRDEQGAIEGVVMVLRDRSQRREAAVERRQLEQKMLEAQRLESLGVLAGGIAHDFNNLLTVMMMNAELIAPTLPPGGSGPAGIRDILLAGRRAAELCQQMLAYAGKGRYQETPFDLSRTVEDTMALLRMAVSKKAALRLSFAAGLPLALADISQMRQVIMNLVINASDALGEAPGVITIETRLVAADRALLEAAVVGADLPVGNYLQLEVRDTGCGMSPEVKARIFDPFFTTKFTGRGLGLAAVLGIVRSHRGALLLDSAPGAGTCFRVLLPVAPAAEASVEPPFPTLAPIPLWQSHGTILVVDDEACIRSAARTVLALFGFTVRLAADGAEALEILAASHGEIRLMLTDLTMPRLNGIEATREASRLYPDLPVLVMSGFSAEATAGRFAQLPIRGFLQKPFTGEQLEKALRGALGEL